MTEYTARSFEKAQLAHHPDGRVAARINDSEYPWAGISEGGARENFGDGEMARKGWSPVRECPDPEQHGPQERPETPSEALVERAEKAEEELREARIALSSWEYNLEQRLDHAMKEATGELAGRLKRTETQLRVCRERAYARQREANEAKARAEKAEQERDEALRRVRRGECAYCTEPLDYAGLPRPIEVTDEMVKRAGESLNAATGYSYAHVTVREALTAALAEPTRPEGAEEIEALLDVVSDEWDGEWDGEWDTLADFLASRGVRVTGAES